MRPDLYPPQDFRARADQYAGADDRVPVAGVFPRAAQRHLVKDRDIVLDDRCLADDEGGRVVEQDATADARRRMDVGGENLGGNALQIKRQPAPPVPPQLVADAVGAQRHEALEKQQRLQRGKARRIPLKHCQQIPPAGMGDALVAGKDLNEKRLQHPARHVLPR